jgi:hypothetical protein
MKKVLLLMMAGFSTLAMSQNVTENKLSFTYTQLPLNPIEKSATNYSVVVERHYEQANEDSLVAYQARLESATLTYDAEVLAWEQRKKVIYRDYFTKMAVWQKAVNAATPATKPTDPIIPPGPIMKRVKDPMMHGDIEDASVTNAITLQGYDQGEGGAIVTVGINPISSMQIVMKKTGTAAQTKYVYTVNYRMPVNVKVEDGNGIVWQTILLNDVRSYDINTYASQYEHDLWWIDNEATFWSKFESSARNSSMAEVQKQLNDQCGFPLKTRSMEIYTVKKFKDHKYNDLVNAYTAATQGYMKVGTELDHSDSGPKLNQAIAIWKQALGESNVADNKARVNDKVTALLYCNLAEAYLWLNDFDQSLTYINLAKNAGVNKFKRISTAIDGRRSINKTRYQANQ